MSNRVVNGMRKRVFGVWSGRKMFRLIISLGLIACLMSGMAPMGNPARAAGETVVQFPDSNLASAVRETLQLVGGDDVTVSMMAELTELDLSGRNIANLAGLEHAVQLRSLNLSFNKVSNLQPLQQLTTLERLILDNAGNLSATAISGLDGLVNLAELSVANMMLVDADMDKLDRFPNLEVLNLSANRLMQVPDISQWPNLKRLDLSRNYIREAGGLAEAVGLESLNLSGNLIRNAAVLSPLTQLTELGLSNNLMEDLSGMTVGQSLKLLDLSYNRLASLSGLSLDGANPNLAIHLYGNELDESEYQPLEGFAVITSDPSALQLQYEVMDLQSFQEDYLLKFRIRAVDADEQLLLVNPERFHFSIHVFDEDGPASGIRMNVDSWTHYDQGRDRIVTTDQYGRAEFRVHMSYNEEQAADFRNELLGEGVEYHIVLPLPPGQYDLALEAARYTSSLARHVPLGRRTVASVNIEGDAPSDVHIPDSALQDRLREYLKVEQQNPITDLDMMMITKFTFEILEPYENPEGLHHAKNLRSFTVQHNHEKQFDLAYLTHFPNLQRLAVYNSIVTGWDDVAAMESLTILDMIDTPVGQLPDLSGLNRLERLHIEGSGLADLSPLIRRGEWEDPILQNLKHLVLIGKEIHDIGPIAELAGLEYLFVEQTSVRDISAVSNLQNLKSLHVANSLVIDVSPIGSLNELDHLAFNRNLIENIAPLASLSRVGQLVLTNNLIRDLDGVDFANFPVFDLLDLDFNPLQNIASLADLPPPNGPAGIDLYYTGIEGEDEAVLLLQGKGYAVGTGQYGQDLEVRYEVSVAEGEGNGLVIRSIVEDPDQIIPYNATDIRLVFRLFDDETVADGMLYAVDGGPEAVTDEFGYGIVYAHEVNVWDDHWELDEEAYATLMQELGDPVLLQLPQGFDMSWAYLELILHVQYDDYDPWEPTERKLFKLADLSHCETEHPCAGSGTDIPPTLVLKGDNPLIIRLGQAYSEPGYTAFDAFDRDLTDRVTVNGEVNTDEVGEYVLYYLAEDDDGNMTEAVRTVRVVEGPLFVFATLDKSGKRIRLAFDRPLDFAHQLNPQRFQLAGANMEVISVAYDSLDPQFRQVVIELSHPLVVENPVMTVQAGAVIDFAGQEVSAETRELITFGKVLDRAAEAELELGQNGFHIADVVKLSLHETDMTGDGIFDEDDVSVLLVYIDSIWTANP